MIKRFASHCLYVSESEIYKQQIVELRGGIVHEFYSMNEEMHSVVWLGGIIVLSPQANPEIKTEIRCHELIKLLTVRHNELPLYAYFIDSVNVRNCTFPVGFKLKRLG